MSIANIFFDVEDVDRKIYSLMSEESYFDTNVINNLSSLPDVFLLNGDLSIGVDAVREVGAKIAIAPNILTYKYILCKDCHLLTEAAQNALLKHLEQNYSYLRWFFFTESKYEYLLLPTIKSRFVLHYDDINKEENLDEVNMYISKIKQNEFDFEVLNLDVLLKCFHILYEADKNTYWLKLINRVLKIKAFEQNHLKWSKTTKLAMIFKNLV